MWRSGSIDGRWRTQKSDEQSGSLRTHVFPAVSGPNWTTTSIPATAEAHGPCGRHAHTDGDGSESFSLANMVPQNAQHNGGAWNQIELDTRRYVRRAKGDVFIITGPVFSERAPRIGANGVKVPAYLFKLVYDATTQRAWAHWQENREGEIAGPPISYQELVRRTGVEFLRGVSVQR